MQSIPESSRRRMLGPCFWKVPQIYLFSELLHKGYNNFLETGNSWLFGCKNFFFSWIGFVLHVSGELQNNQSFLLLLDWICIACVWRTPKQSILSSSPGLDLHCMCLENSKTIIPFFFSWIGFALHVSREVQNNQSFLLLLDWIGIACVWRSPKQSILSSSPGLDFHCMSGEF